MSSAKIKKDLEQFQDAVKRLGDGVGKAAPLWNDAKFSELSASVSSVAAQSMDLMVSGEKACTSIDRFNKIASEQY